MGMTASQARYLALTARKTNTEYEGQQINQARTALANQSADLFNRLLDLEVPVAPKTTDYTEIQYSYSDGTNESVLEEWTQLSSPNPDSNYLVKHYYYTEQYTGSMKKLDDPQVVVDNGGILTTNAGLQQAVDNLNNSESAYNNAINSRDEALKNSQNLLNYSIDESIYTARRVEGGYEILDGNGNVVERFMNYLAADPQLQQDVDLIYATLEGMQAIPDGLNKQNDMFINANGEVALRSDLEALHGILPTGGNFSLPIYDENNVTNRANTYRIEISTAEMNISTSKIAYDNALEYYNGLDVPTFIGNCELTLIDKANEKHMKQIKQIVTDMKNQNIQDGISKCFNENGEYEGGIYSFMMNGKEYFTTYEELMASYNSHTGPNDIDGQIKLPYYNTSYIQKKVEETKEALIETDSNGRFKSVKFADDSTIYSLNTETVTDEAAYQDAMNEYNYKVQQYEKIIADINAKTSIIQEEDRTLELRLKQLETEQNALSVEMDAVKKVVKDHVDKVFKTFSD